MVNESQLLTCKKFVRNDFPMAKHFWMGETGEGQGGRIVRLLLRCGSDKLNK